MGTCVSKRDRAGSQELLKEIAALQAVLRDQRAEADAAVKALTARVEHLERFSEDLVKLTTELKRDQSGSGASPTHTEPLLSVASSRSEAGGDGAPSPDDPVRLAMSPGVDYGLAFDTDSKGHVLKAVGPAGASQGLRVGLHIIQIDDKPVPSDVTSEQLPLLLRSAHSATFTTANRRGSKEGELLQAWLQPIGKGAAKKQAGPKITSISESESEAPPGKRTLPRDFKLSDSSDGPSSTIVDEMDEDQHAVSNGARAVVKGNGPADSVALAAFDSASSPSAAGAPGAGKLGASPSFIAESTLDTPGTHTPRVPTLAIAPASLEPPQGTRALSISVKGGSGSESRRGTGAGGADSRRGTSAMVRKTVTVVRDEEGYGIGIAGGRMPGEDTAHTVFIKHIREGSAAARSGELKERDRVISINGTMVEGMDHGDIVAIMKTAAKVVIVVDSKESRSKKAAVESLPEHPTTGSGASEAGLNDSVVSTSRSISISIPTARPVEGLHRSATDASSLKNAGGSGVSAKGASGNAQGEDAAGGTNRDSLTLPSFGTLRHPTLDRPKRPVRPPTRDRANTMERLTAGGEGVAGAAVKDENKDGDQDEGAAGDVLTPSSYTLSPEPAPLLSPEAPASNSKLSATSGLLGTGLSSDPAQRRVSTDRPSVAPRPSPRLPHKQIVPSAAWTEPAPTPTRSTNNASIGVGSVPSLTLANGSHGVSASTLAPPSTPSIAVAPPSPAMSFSRSLAEEAVRARLNKANKEASKETNSVSGGGAVAPDNGGIASATLSVESGWIAPVKASGSNAKSDTLLTTPARAPLSSTSTSTEPPVFSATDDAELDEVDRLNPFMFPPAPSPATVRRPFQQELEAIDLFADTAGGLPGAVYE